MLGHRYVKEISLVAILATKTSAGVTPEVNLREHEICTPPPSVNKTVHSCYETKRRLRQKSKNRGISSPTKRTHVLKKF